MKNTAADEVDLNVPLLPPEMPIEFETSTSNEIFEIESRLSSENIESQEEVIQRLPFLISNFGIDKDVITNIKKLTYNPSDHMIRSEKQLLGSLAQEDKLERIDAISNLHNGKLNHESGEFTG